MPWKFDIPEQRKQCRAEIASETPMLRNGSPMCTAVPTLQCLNKNRLGPTNWAAIWECGAKHRPFMLELCDMQLTAGRYILHGHPLGASSWHLPEMAAYMAKWELSRFSSHVCRFGVRTHRGHESGLVKKTLASSRMPNTCRADCKTHCVGGHCHLRLLHGRATRAKV